MNNEIAEATANAERLVNEIIAAAQAGNKETVNTLLINVQPGVDLRPAISAAENAGYEEIAETLKKYIIDAFYNASVNGQMQIVERLLLTIPDNLEVRDAIWAAIIGRHNDIANLLQDDIPLIKAQAWRLRTAYTMGHNDEVDRLLNIPAAMDFSLALEFAAQDGNIQMVSRILEKSSGQDFDCTFAVKLAAYMRHTDTVRLLSQLVFTRIDFAKVTSYAKSIQDDSVIANMLQKSFEEALADSAWDENEEGVIILLRSAPLDYDCREAIINAVIQGHKSIIKLLMKDAPEPLKKSWQLRIAVSNKDKDQINLFLADPVLDRATALALILGLEENIDKDEWINKLFQNTWNAVQKSHLLRIASNIGEETLVDKVLSGAPPFIEYEPALDYAREHEYEGIQIKLEFYSELANAWLAGDDLKVTQLIQDPTYSGFFDFGRVVLHMLPKDLLNSDQSKIGEVIANSASQYIQESWNLWMACMTDTEKNDTILKNGHLDKSLALSLFAMPIPNGSQTRRDEVERMIGYFLKNFHKDINFDLVLEAAEISKNNTFALIMAASNGRESAVDKILSLGLTSLNFRFAIRSALDQGHEAIANKIKLYFNNALTKAINDGSEDTIKELFENPPEDHDFHSTLKSVANRDDVAITVADSRYSNAKNSWTLWSAVKDNNVEEVKRLKNENEVHLLFALEMAVYFNNKAAVDLLLNQFSPLVDIRNVINIALSRQSIDLADDMTDHFSRAIEDAAEKGDWDAINKALIVAPERISLKKAIQKARNNQYEKIAIRLEYFAANLFETIVTKGNVTSINTRLKDTPYVLDYRWGIAIAAYVGQYETMELIGKNSSASIQNLINAFIRAKDHGEIDVFQTMANTDWSLSFSLAFNIKQGEKNHAKKLWEQSPEIIDRSVALAATILHRDVKLMEEILAEAPQEVDRTLAIVTLANQKTFISEEKMRQIAEKLLEDAPPSLETNRVIARCNELAVPWLENRVRQYFTQALTNAVTYGKRGMVEKLLKTEPYNFDRSKVLETAALKGYEHIVTSLLKDAPKNLNIQSAVKNAAGAGHDEVVVQLLNYGSSDIDISEAVAVATMNGHDDVVTALLKHAASVPNLIPALDNAAVVDERSIAKLLLEKAPNDLDCSTSLVYAVTNGHEKMVKLLLKEAPVLNFKAALTEAARLGYQKIVEHLIASKRGDIDVFSSVSVALISQHEEIAKLIIDNSNESIQKAWEFREIVKNRGATAAQTYLNDNPDTDRSFALAFITMDKRGAIVDQLLNGPQEGLDRKNAINAAVNMGNLSLVEKLLKDSPITLRFESEIEITTLKLQEASHNLNHAIFNRFSNEDIGQRQAAVDSLQKLRTTLDRQNNINRLISSRPSISFEVLSDAQQKEADEKRQAWLNDVIGAGTRVDEHVMPSLAEAVQPWLPKELSKEKKAEFTKKFQELDKQYKEEIAPFTAFISLAETTKDFVKHKDAYRKRIWQLLEVMIDKDHTMLSTKSGKNDALSDKEHTDLQQRISANALDALGACVDRLANGLKRLERIVMYEKARHFEKVEEHVDFMEKMFTDDMKSHIAEIKAAEVWLDGYQFPPNHVFQQDDPRSVQRHNWNEQVEVKSLLDMYMGKEYQFDDSYAVMQFEGSVEKWARNAKPEKYNDPSDENTARHIAMEAKEIIDELREGNQKPEVLIKLIDSANQTRRADGRMVDGIPNDARPPTDKIILDPRKIMTLEDYAIKEHPLWGEFVEKKYEELFDRLKDQEADFKDDDNIEGDINGTELEKIRAKIYLIEKQFAPEGWKGNRIDSAFSKSYQRWALLPENEKQDDDLSKLYQKQVEITNKLNTNELAKDLLRQYRFAKKFMTKGQRWEPFGLHNMNSGASYFVIGTQDGKTCLQRESAPPQHIIVLNNNHLPSEFQDPEILKSAMKEKNRVYIKCNEGKIVDVKIASGLKRKREGLSTREGLRSSARRKI